ncbi:MAG: hypothetical protein U0U46_12125 [Saprospiraceae bacterium]|nr:hypothetical protein [Saprospiraceae bacterium]
MLRSYISFAARGDVVLQQEIMGHLGIGANGVLYGALSPSENSLVLSQIPPKYWHRALKIIIHTHHVPGSLAAAAQAIASLEFDTISSWSSTESSEGHSCFTSIVVYDSEKYPNLDCSDIEAAITNLLPKELSKLEIFDKNILRKVRVTPLSFLNAYSDDLSTAEFQRVQVVDHSLQLGKSRCLGRRKFPSLWQQLLTANQNPNASSCILTPDTEEAFLRISLVEERARLVRLGFRVHIHSDQSSFAGYWKEALDVLKESKYNVFVAHNLLVSKNDEQNREEAEFHFIVDRRNGQDTGLPLDDLKEHIKSRLDSRLKSFARERGAEIDIKGLKVTYPRGVGVPCFFACNAKQRDGLGAEAAVRLCRVLEGHGFKPVNIDIAAGGEGLQEQVKKLMSSCQFMVVLQCPDENLKSNKEGEYFPAPWVLFEEALMLGQKGEIYRYRFDQVMKPNFWHGFTETIIPREGFQDKDPLLQDFNEKLDRWSRNMSKLNSSNLDAPPIDDKILERDLVTYYGGRD